MAYLIHPMRWYERIMFIAGGVLMVDPGAVTDIVGIAVIGSAVLIQILRKKAAKAV